MARYKKGDWLAVCDSCGQRYLASKLRKRWDGLMVCPKDFESRHPQDFVRAKVDIQAVPWTRPESETYVFQPISWTRNIIENPSSFVSGFPNKLVSKSDLNEQISNRMEYVRVIEETLGLSEVFTRDSPGTIVGTAADSLNLSEYVVSNTYPPPSVETISIDELIMTSLVTQGINNINLYSMNTKSLG